MTEVDEIADELYRLPPEDFIAARDQHAKELSKAKERDTAKEVRALRRPTVPAWALNQLRWEAADDLDALFATTEELRAAQEAAIRDPEAGRKELRELTQQHRRQVQQLTDAAVAALRSAERDPATHRAPIESTLRAATTDASVAEALQQGRLTATAEPQGFGEIPADWAPPQRTATPFRKPRPKRPSKASAEPEPEPRSAPKPSTAEQRRQQAAADQKRRDLERQLDRARRRLERADEERAAAANEVDHLESALQSLSG